MTNTILSLRNIRKTRAEGQGFTLEIPHLHIKRGEKVALVGASGCGKSTALDLLGTVLCPDMHTLMDQTQEFLLTPHDVPIDIFALWQQGQRDALSALRLQHMGYVLQTGGLLPFLTARENILLACPSQKLSHDMPKHLGIDHLLDALPARLSVGERQRVAIARALAHNPTLVLADEPTAALDPLNARTVMELFTRLADHMGVTVVLVTHAPALAAEMGFRLVQTSVHHAQRGIWARMGDTL